MTDDDREDPNPRATVPDGPAPRRVLCVQADDAVPPGAFVVKGDGDGFVFTRGDQSIRVTAEEIARFAAEYARRMGVAK